MLIGTRVALGFGLVLSLSACEGQDPFAFLKPADIEEEPGQSTTVSQNGETRDVAAPEVFGVTEAGLWDGRPSLGGVWVAYPDVQTPERVTIRNLDNGSSVIGALFRRERDNPGPRFQVSSDAAEALNILAGVPTQLEVIAIKREVIAPEPEETPEEVETETATPEEPDTAALAAAAIEEAELRDDLPGSAPIEASALPTSSQESPLERPFIQIGIFNVEANASATEAQMTAAGLAAQTLTEESQGRSFFRVIVGPAQSEPARAAALETVKSLGFTDAFFVAN